MPPVPSPQLTPSWHFEQQFWQAGYSLVAGIDEAGRGAWAGPLTVAAVILPVPLADSREDNPQALPFRDSKTLSAARRSGLALQVQGVAVAYAVEHAWPDEIDRLNVLGATHAAALRALSRLCPAPDSLLTDYLRLPTPLPLLAPAHADALSYSVAAASLLAKTERDRLMTELDERHPGYGFAAHKGYGVSAHRAALQALGVSEQHRRSFKPVANLLRRPTTLQLPLGL